MASGAALILMGVGANAGQAPEPPLVGCYERVYDAAHLSRHKAQLVERASLHVTAPQAYSPADAAPIIADGTLKIWVRKSRESFDSAGACRAEGSVLTCAGSLSAAEADACRSKRDGVHECRIDAGEAGSFKVKPRPGGVLVSVIQRLELVPAPYDAGPFLYLSPSNAENHAFLLRQTPCN